MKDLEPHEKAYLLVHVLKDQKKYQGWMDHRTAHGYIAQSASPESRVKMEHWQDQIARLELLANKLRLGA